MYKEMNYSIIYVDLKLWIHPIKKRKKNVNVFDKLY